MHPRSRTGLAWLVFGATFACLVGGLVVTLFVTRPLTAQVLVNGAFEGAIWLLFATIGLVLTLRRPGNPIGWLYAGAGLAWTLSVPWDPWVDQLVASNRRPLPPAAQLAALAGDSLWAVGLTMAVTLPLLLLPNGRLRSPRWRPVAVASVAGTAATVVGWVLAPDPMTQTIRPVPKPFPLHGVAGTMADTIHWIGWGVLFACIPVAAVSLVLRFRSSRGTERQQLRWVAAGAACAAAGPALLLPLQALGLGPTDAFTVPLLLSLPVAIAVAVLRYRLWDLDRLVSRTVTYAAVTALLLIPYLLVLPAATRLAGGSGSLAVAAATLTAAALFQPLRRRIQDQVDRRFNRRRYDAARTVDAFATRLRDQVDLGALHTELLGVVDQTMQPTHAWLWLRPPARQVPAGG
jgi:hypothetical protein